MRWLFACCLIGMISTVHAAAPANRSDAPKSKGWNKPPVTIGMAPGASKKLPPDANAYRDQFKESPPDLNAVPERPATFIPPVVVLPTPIVTPEGRKCDPQREDCGKIRFTNEFQD